MFEPLSLTADLRGQRRRGRLAGKQWCADRFRSASQYSTQAYQTVHNNLATFVVFHGVIVKIPADIGHAPAARERQFGGSRSLSRPERVAPSCAAGDSHVATETSSPAGGGKGWRLRARLRKHDFAAPTPPCPEFARPCANSAPPRASGEINSRLPPPPVRERLAIESELAAMTVQVSANGGSPTGVPRRACFAAPGSARTRYALRTAQR
jgi:hypothetical protein